MRIVVTGGSGMVGRCINDITSQYPDHKFFFLNSSICNLTNRENTIEFFTNNKFDYIIHLAADVGGLYKNLNDNSNMFSNNIKINENVLEACRLNNINRGIFILSSCIYPNNPSKFPMDENMIHESPPHPSNEGYAYAKRMLEIQTKHYNRQYKTNYICLVPVNLYGPYDNFNLGNSHFIPGIMHRFYIENNIKKSGNLFAFGSGKPYRQFLYAPDFAKIILNVLFNYRDNTPIICCDNNEYTIKDIVFKLSSVMDIKYDNIKWDSSKSDGCMKKTVSNNKLLSLFPNTKFTDIDDGLKESFKWFVENYDSIRK